MVTHQMPDQQTNAPASSETGLKPITTHMFWAYGDLSNLEKISVNSFVVQGYDVNLWTYGEISNAPPGLTVKNAREIYPEDRVFLNKAKSYASFADMFRYKALSRIGGLYADTDVIALKAASTLPNQPFLVTERLPNVKGVKGFVKSIGKRIFGESVPTTINCNVLFNPYPSDGNIIDLAHVYSERFRKDDIVWSELGPDLLTAFSRIYPSHHFEIMEPDFANPIDYWDCPRLLLAPARDLPERAHFLHCFNMTWRQAGIDKNAEFPSSSLMAKYAEMYLY